MYNNIYFIGIGGIGMSAIARYYKFKGMNVSGYDRTPSALTHALEEEGIAVHYEDRPDLIPADKESTLVVYTPAIPESLGELRAVKEKGYSLLKRSRILGEITKGQRCLAVSGTHGKTTTSTLVAHILTESGEGCSAFLGGISKNYETNMLVSKNPTVVVEADEFDRSFHQLYPEISVITAMDADHLDIYGTHEKVIESFLEYASHVSGYLIIKKGLPVSSKYTKAKIYSYSVDDQTADFHAENIRLGSLGHYTYDLHSPMGTIKDILVGTLGKVNVENSIAAAAECLLYGIESDKIRKAIASFEGAVRRIDVRINRPGMTYIDDYAHHPEELATCISSLRGIFPGRKITAVFQPHLFTRTRDFASGFAKALSMVDKLILLDIYPAREEPIPGVTSEIIYKDVSCEKLLLHKENLMDYLKEEKEKIDVLVTFGAGDIDRFISPITELFS